MRMWTPTLTKSGGSGPRDPHGIAAHVYLLHLASIFTIAFYEMLSASGAKPLDPYQRLGP
jgi:hypothetical protein